MKLSAAAFLSAFVFGLGLGVSGMTLPAKVIGFLDITGNWDLSLILVMFGAIAVHGISYRMIKLRESPLLCDNFQIPTNRKIDRKLVLGSLLFGIGWGIGGYCPGPALVGSVTGKPEVLVFLVSMVVGIYLHAGTKHFISKHRS